MLLLMSATAETEMEAHPETPGQMAPVTGNIKVRIFDEISQIIFEFHGRRHMQDREDLKVSKSQNHFFLKIHCPKNKRNI